MPELPEVETVVRELRPRLVGKRITALEVGPLRLRRQWLPEWQRVLLGNKIATLRRRGKWIILDLHSGRHLVIHLGMTGQLRVHPALEQPDTHTHILVSLNKGTEQLRFRDI